MRVTSPVSHHVCPHPLWHRLGICVATIAWLFVGIPLCMQGIYLLTHSGALALLSAGMATAMVWLVRDLSRWRCQIVVQPSHCYPLRDAVVATWVLRQGNQ